MKLGILCAGDVELAPFLPLLQGGGVTEKAGRRVHTGAIAGVETAAVVSGMCKVNAAIAAQILVDTFRVDAVINAGTAGGMDPGLEILDTVISTDVVYHDVSPEILTDFSPRMETASFPADAGLLELSKRAVEKGHFPHRVVWGRMATGEAFIDTRGRQEINDRYAPLSVDMETGTVAHVCRAYGVPFLAIRSITDTAAHSGVGNFAENCRAASIVAREITVALLGEL